MDLIDTLEARAAEAVRRLTRLEPRGIGDDTSPLHDFDLFDANARVGALEVTQYQATSMSGHRQLLAALGGLRLELPGVHVRGGWKLRLNHRARVKQARAGIDRALAAVERLGLTEITQFSNVSHPPQVDYIHREFGITSGLAIGGPPRIILEAGDGWGGNVPEDAANRVALEGAARKRRQLRRAQEDGLGQRHLWIWVDPVACGLMALGLLSLHMRNEHPPSPHDDVLTDLWVATEWPPPFQDWTHLRDLHPHLSVDEAIAIFEDAGGHRMLTESWDPVGYEGTCIWHARPGGPWAQTSLVSSDVVLGIPTPWYRQFYERRLTA